MKTVIWGVIPISIDEKIRSTLAEVRDENGKLKYLTCWGYRDFNHFYPIALEEYGDEIEGKPYRFSRAISPDGQVLTKIELT